MEVSKRLDKTKLSNAVRAVIRQVRQNSFNEGKKDLVLDIGIAQGISDRELEDISAVYGSLNIEQAWVGREVFVAGEKYTSKQWGQQTRWIIQPVRVIEERIA